MWQFANLAQYISLFSDAVKIDKDFNIEDEMNHSDEFTMNMETTNATTEPSHFAKFYHDKIEGAPARPTNSVKTVALPPNTPGEAVFVRKHVFEEGRVTFLPGRYV
jgi:hypothetical protein